ncbi:MAG: tRNA wybutosine-synthesizing 3 family protein [Candidatus Woesearchaeota archaeon]
MTDKSPQGFVDEDIKALLDKINSSPDYETTSSCSGRIVMLETQKKDKSEWLFKSHSAVSAKDILDSLPEGRVWFMQEPMILHVKCSSLEAADELIKKANAAGLKVSGVTSIKNILVEIRDTNRIDTILKKDLVNEDYIRLLVEEANKKLLETKGKIKKLERMF